MVPNLLRKLPAEVRLIILSLLPQQDLLSIRQVSEAWLCAEVDDEIIRTHPGTVSFMFERRSLEGFLQICDIPRFASHVHTLDICVRHLLPLNERRHSGDTDGDGSDTDGTCISQASALRLDGQNELMRDYAFLKCFHEALQKLTECKTIIFNDHGPPRGPCSPTKGVDPSHYRGLVLKSGDSIAFVSKSLNVVLNGPNLPHLEAVTFDIGQFSIKNRDGLKPTMLPSLSSSVANVRRLSLHLDQKFLDGPELQTFVEGLPELLELGLEIVDEDWMTGTLPFLSKITIPKLRKLRLRGLACKMHELNDFLLQHQDTLSHVILYMVYLHGTRSWDRIDQTLSHRLNLQEISMECCGIASDRIAESCL
ncbi:hypothetical protein FSARC_2966 [Fusarium sarcochroum]|uniref:F-box domain-containing protein n=1 Tax=Fusarium sarcochroum TaxID=1208366 RepID=A0A8H4U5H9_9HYPO|nr:hypothetical protein FSARC_2966 [Fusarium sarcochroum]